MPPKGKKSGGGGQAGGEEEREAPLQAVILTDAFETRFRPFTLERPRCLLPLANTPLIEYTFEFLANAGVEEVFVYCGAHTEQIEDYISHTKWSSHSSPFAKVELIRSSSRTIGDAMRDLDKRAILVNDFLIVYGDIVATLPLDRALAAHKARKQKDKNAIMTIVLAETGTDHRTKPRETIPVFVIDPQRERCLHYEQISTSRGYGGHLINVDEELLGAHAELDIRTDLLDTGIDICTPDALALWSDNFDFQAPRRNFLHSVLKDYELNGKTIHTHIISDHYAARVRNLHAYASVSKDICSRWSYPLCPDSNLLRGQSYQMYKGNVYKEQNVILARSSVLGRGTVVGKGTSVGDGTIIENSVIGRGCIIGKNVVIRDAYVWDHATIGDLSSITRSIVGHEASVGKRCKVGPGALISFSVHVADGTDVRSGGRLTRVKRPQEDEEETIRGDDDAEVVGKGGTGFEYQDGEEEDEELQQEVAAAGLVYRLPNAALTADSISTLNSESDISEHLPRSAAASFTSVASDEGGAASHGSNFHHEAVATILDAIQQGQDPGNVQIEMQNLKITNNASEEAVRKAVVTGAMKRVFQLTHSGSTAKAAVDAILPRYKLLFERTLSDKDAHRKADQIDFMLAIQRECSHQVDGDGVLLHLSTALSRDDVIQTEGFEQWWEDSRSTASPEMKTTRGKTQQLIDFLLDDDSGEEDEDEDEDEEHSD